VTRIVVLDNEAVQALMSVDHPKHRRVLAHVQVVAARKKRAVALDVLAPTAVRAEAGWDRTSHDAAFINLLRIRDAPLDTNSADMAAAIVSAHGVSVADAHVGAVIQARHGTGSVTVLSSDPDDMRAVAGTATVTVVRL
jgi:predicted nucleic acid-binding protein